MSRTIRAAAITATVASFATLALSGSVTACGSRGPLDADGPLDAGLGADTSPIDLVDATSPIDSSVVADAAKEGGSILGCGTCLVGQCGAGILACVQDTSCRQIFQCVVTDCLSGGGSPNPACLLKCASGDLAGGLKIFQIFQCVTGKCGEDCNPVLAGLLGGLGGLGGGGGGGGKDGGKGGGGGGGGGKGGGGGVPASPSAKPLSPFAQSLAHGYPELCGPLEDHADSP